MDGQLFTVFQCVLLLSCLLCGILFADDCTDGGGSCNNCGTYKICVGGTHDNKIFWDQVACNTGTLLGACESQSDLPCVCAGCDSVVGAAGVYTCKESNCTTNCDAVPELPSEGSLAG